MKKAWKAKCIDVGYGSYCSLGDIIAVEDNIIKVVTDCNGNINIQKTERLKGDKFAGIDDLNFKISGTWKLITDEPADAIEKEKDMGIDIFKTGSGNLYELTDEGLKQILGTPVSEIEQDAINPDHYKSQCSLECIDAMIMAFGPDHVYKWCVITAWKYMWRYRNKNGVQDIEKARWYIDKAMELGFDEPEVYNLEYVLEKIEKEVGCK